MEPVIVLENISKSFKLKKLETNLGSFRSHKYLNNRLVALEEISFQVLKGEMIAIIGTNGSGKTSLLRIIAGILKPDSGTVRVNGRIAPLLQIGTGFNNELTAKENIIIAGMLLGIPRSEIKKKVNEIIEFAELQEFVDMKLKHYSSGMKARLAFSTAMQVDPDILLVDEILSVGDITFRKKSYDSFLSFKKNGRTIVYTTHNLSDLPKICDRVVLLHNGKIIMVDKPEQVINKYRDMMNPTNAISINESKKGYEIQPTQDLKINSELIPIDYTKFYEWQVRVDSAKVGDRSAYVAVLFLKEGKEVGRRIRYIINSPSLPKEYEIVSAVPFMADNAILAYRVNCQGAQSAYNFIEFPPMQNNVLKLAENFTSQQYDNVQI